ncbi:MAG: isoleucine--tRNA ligase, partial [Zetaproteobacteria bacterium]
KRDPMAFRAACRRYAAEQVEVQKEEFARLGVLGDWEHPYLTMDPRFEADTIRELGKLLANGALYRGEKPVYWCISCETALAEAEVEYGPHRSPSIYVKFAAEGAAALDAALNDKPVYFVIWTTTPWTLPANLALAVHPEHRYALVDLGDECWIVAEALAEQVLAAAGRKGELRRSWPGKALTALSARHPWLEGARPVLPAEFVTLDAGTGIVHIAPGHGEEDYELGCRHKLKPFSPIDARGVFANDVPIVGGLRVWEANDAVIEALQARGALVAHGAIEHSYPHCWRCHNPLVFRATPQWFISMERNGLRTKALEAIERVRWWPRWGQARIRAMVSDRPDWCISRQRHWGTPITILRCRQCGSHAITTPEVIEQVARVVEREGADAWFAHPAEDFLPPEARCPDCGGTEFEKETDILDVWFDSGSTHACVLEKRPELSWPADLYLEGSDQHRGWFQSSLLEAVATRGDAPYREVLTHGFVVDERGEKMSKSRGNVVAPQEVIRQYGAEVLRLWVAASDYTGDLRISEAILEQLAETYRRIRFTLRFLLGNLADFDPGKDYVPEAQRAGIDRWALKRIAEVGEGILASYNEYNFHRIHHLVREFCAADLGGFYLDVLKDRLYCDAAASPARRSAQSTCYDLLQHLLRWIAPILPFTANEAWQHLPGEKPEHVQMAEFLPLPRPELDEEAWARFFALRARANALLDQARKQERIGANTEASVRLAVPASELEALERRLGEKLAFLLGVAEVQASDADAVERARGVKCPRCWIVRPPA